MNHDTPKTKWPGRGTLCPFVLGEHMARLHLHGLGVMHVARGNVAHART
jgi:hypothetical protein